MTTEEIPTEPERRIIGFCGVTVSEFSRAREQYEKALEEGWKLDPWLGIKTLPGVGALIHMVKSPPDRILELDPTISLPEEPKPPRMMTEADTLALAEDFVEIKAPETPGEIPDKYPGWKIFKATKGLLQLYKPRPESEPKEAEG